MTFGSAKIASQNTISDDILLCLQTLFSTTQGTIPLDREFGVDPDIVSSPTDVAMNLYTLDAIAKVDRYEPRVKVTSVDFSIGDGILTPTIHIERVEASEEV